MAIKKTDTNDLEIGQNQTKDLPASGHLNRAELKDQIETIDTPEDSHRTKNLLFAEEMVEVTIIDNGSADAEQLIKVGCNGINQFLIRGLPTMIRRKYLEVLARAKLGNVTTIKYIDMQGNDSTRINVTHSLRHPFTVTKDTAKGTQWLRSVLAEA